MLDLDAALTLFFLSTRAGDLESTGLLDYLCDKQASMPRKSSFLSILYRRLTSPIRISNPFWALNAIAEICYRGRLGETAEVCRTTDHELLGSIAADTSRDPSNKEFRRRLEGSLHNFIDAERNLHPYVSDDILSEVVNAAKKVIEWLRTPSSNEPSDHSPLVELRDCMFNHNSWAQFGLECHMPIYEFEKLLRARHEQLCEDKEGSQYRNVLLEIEIEPLVQEWCLMTHIRYLRDFISNIAIEPAKNTKPSGPSRLVIKSDGRECSQSIILDIHTRFGSSSRALNAVARSPKILRSLDNLERFGVSRNKPTIDNEHPGDGICISLIVPIGFQPARR